MWNAAQFISLTTSESNARLFISKVYSSGGLSFLVHFS